MDTALENDKNVIAEDYFVLAIRNWDDKREDYFSVDDPLTMIQTFKDFQSAEDNYFSTNYDGCAQAGGKDVKVELLHMRFGISHIVRNRIIFP